MATIKDIATETNLSLTTVSLVLRGEAANGRIAPATRERVMEAAQRLRYRRNEHARTLRTGRSDLIGLFGINLTHPYTTLIVQAMAKEVVKRGYNVSFFDLSWYPEHFDRALADMGSLRPDGMLLVDSSASGERQTRRVLEAFGEWALPVVSLEYWGVPTTDVVEVDREAGSYDATRHLLEQGHRKIVLTVDPGRQSASVQQRLRGYLRAHAEAGVPVDESLLLAPVLPYPGAAEGARLAKLAMEHPARPTAMFLMNDRMAIGTLQALHAAGRRIPEDMAVVGFDGTPEAETSMVPLSTVAQPVPGIAEHAVSMLIERIRNQGEPIPVRRVVLAPEFIPRRSSLRRLPNPS